MSLNAAAVQVLVDKGLSAQDIADVMAAAERKKDNTAAERQARYRANKKAGKSRRNSNGVTPPIDNNHTPRDISSNDESLSARDVERVVEHWRLVAKPLNLPCWEKITPQRRKKLKSRLSDHGFEAIVQAIDHVPKSEFLRGDKGSWGGANLDFLTKPDSVPSILEGKYDDRKPANDRPNSNRAGSLRGPAEQALAALESRGC